MNLYPQKADGKGYYCKNRHTGCSKIILHPDSVSHGCITVSNSTCWSKLKSHLREQQSCKINVTDVEHSSFGSFVSFSCKGSWYAGNHIEKPISVIGALTVTY